MTYEKTVQNLTEWMTLTPTEVLDKFHGLNNAFSDGLGQDRFVFIPGEKDDRALIVAHADTVFDDPVKIGYYSGVFFSKQKGVGIGADDRAGTALAWSLRNLGHSLLITHGEENGQKAANKLMDNDYWRDIINQTHSFAIQLDRKNHRDLVFYDKSSKEFASFMTENTGYKPEKSWGRTDIKALCTLISGVNISVGYYNEHTDEEKLVLDYWLNTSRNLKKILRKKKLPHFPLPEKHIDRYSVPYVSNYNYGSYRQYDEDYYGNYNRQRYYNTPNNNNVIQTAVDTNEETIICPYCTHQMSLTNWFENLLLCTKCHKETK